MKSYDGFSLVELVIAVVIVGLIISMVLSLLGGRENAWRQSVVSELSQMLVADKTFRQTYRYRAGDHPEPERYFSGDAATAGDGDGYLDTAAERNVLWVQFSAAELLPNSYELPATVATDRVLGTHRPASRYEGAGWTFLNSMTIDPPGAVGSLTYRNVFRIGGWESGANGGEDLSRAVLTVADHRYLDEKIDVQNTPATGNYVVGEDSTCMTESGGVYSYSTNPDAQCTGNYVER